MNAPHVAAGRFVGQRLTRKEDARLLTGRGSFIDDVSFTGMLHVAFARSPIARGKIRSIDLHAARALPGVRAIYTADDFLHFNIEMVSFYMMVPPPGPKVHPLAKDRVAYVGDPVALIVADTRYIAEDAAGLVFIDIEAEDAVVTIADAKTKHTVHPESESNISAAAGFPEDEELEAILAAAPHLVDGAVKHQRIAQAPMEGRGVVVSKNGEEVTIHLGCQSPHLAVRIIALAFGVPESSLRVISKDVGGSFGLKVQPWREEMATIAAGMLLNRPLKWVEDRLENLTSANQAREQECRLRIAFDNEGKLLASAIDYDYNNGAFPHMPDCNMPVAMFLWAAHKIPRQGFYVKGWHTNTVGQGAYRGPWAMETLVREAMLDVAARKMNIDPLELRRKNLVTAADQPMMTQFGMMLEDVTPSECLDNLLSHVDVAAFRAEQAAARAQGRYLGIGFATYIEPTAGSSFSVLQSDVAHIRVEPTGKVTAILSTHSQGHGTQTTMAQVIAETLGVRYEDVSVYEDDSSRGGYGPGASGSRQAVAGGGASIKCSEILVDKIKRIAGHLLNANPEDVRIEGGVVRVEGVEQMTRPLREIAEIAYNEPDRLPPGMECGIEAQYRYRPPPITFASAAHACIVEVDAVTGFVSIKRWVSSEDCGIMINPSVVEGQIAGGLAQAIGEVLLEEISYDGRGNPTAVTFKDYLLPTIFDVPDFEYTHIVTPSKATGGFRGVGEGGAIIGPPTLVNAIADALAPFNIGTKHLDLPLTPSKIIAMMEAGA
jgi:carbon-monoxide dehydrogenase large subunit